MVATSERKLSTVAPERGRAGEAVVVALDQGPDVRPPSMLLPKIVLNESWRLPSHSPQA
jgi:hypothetical protein